MHPFFLHLIPSVADLVQHNVAGMETIKDLTAWLTTPGHTGWVGTAVIFDDAEGDANGANGAIGGKLPGLLTGLPTGLPASVKYTIQYNASNIIQGFYQGAGLDPTKSATKQGSADAGTSSLLLRVQVRYEEEGFI